MKIATLQLHTASLLQAILVFFAWRRLAVCSQNIAIYITCDYIVRQKENLAFNVSDV